MRPNDSPPPTSIPEVVAAYEALMQRFAEQRTPDLLETAVSMPQMKALFLIATGGEIHMSALTARLGVSISTVSGLVDRLVDHDLVARRDDPVDRRQVILAPTQAGQALVDRFRELGSAQFRGLLERLAPDDVAAVGRAIAILAGAADAAAAKTPPTPDPADPAAAASRKDPS
jgi:DNA-binding MarR family transcriptional regulator